jgi:pimeloyl-ACP methyl ester carboxylesterase
MLSSFAEGALFGERHGELPLSVLALHGWGRSHRDFDAALGGFAAVALDLPGFGATPAPPTSMASDDFAAAIEQVLDEAIAPVVVVGHSHGGRVAVRLAARRPESIRGLVLIGAPVLRRQGRAKPARRFRVLKGLRRLGLVSEARVEAYRRSHGSADYRAAEGVQRDTLVRIINESFEPELRALRCPVILLWGAEDADVPVEVAERAAALIGTALPEDERPSVRLEVLPGIGHLVPTAAPDAVEAAIRSLLQ